MSYELRWKKEAVKDLEKLDHEKRQRIVDKLEWFAERPDRKRNVKYIEKYGSFRYRIGDSRIFFQKLDDEEVIEILTIDRRPQAYR